MTRRIVDVTRIRDQPTVDNGKQRPAKAICRRVDLERRRNKETREN